MLSINLQAMVNEIRSAWMILIRSHEQQQISTQNTKEAAKLNSF